MLVWIFFAATLLLTSAPTLVRKDGSIDSKDLQKLTHKHQLPLPEALRRAVTRRVADREHGEWKSGLLGLGIGVLAAFVVGQDWAEAALILLPTMFGLGIGSYFSTKQPQAALDESAPRVARPIATELVDYSTKGERLANRLALVGVLLALAAALTIWWLVPVRPPGGPLVPTLIAAAAAAGIALMIAVTRGANRIVQQPQHANSELELAWDDALRADSIRSFLGTSIATGMVLVLGILATAGTWVIAPDVRAEGMELTMRLGTSALITGLLIWIAVSAAWLAGRAKRNPSLSLWQGATFTKAYDAHH